MKWSERFLIGLFPSILFLILLYYNVSSFKAWSIQEALEINGISHQGKVVKKKQFDSTKGGDLWTIWYEYTVHGQVYQTKKDVPQNLFTVSQEGQPISIIYSSANPEISDLSDNTAGSHYLAWVILLDLVVVGSLVLGVYKHRKE